MEVDLRDEYMCVESRMRKVARIRASSVKEAEARLRKKYGGEWICTRSIW